MRSGQVDNVTISLQNSVIHVIGSVILLGFQAAKVGQMLIELKAQCPQRSGLLSFEARFKTEMPDVSAKTRSTLMTLARNQSLIEEKKPESQRAG